MLLGVGDERFGQANYSGVSGEGNYQKRRTPFETSLSALGALAFERWTAPHYLGLLVRILRLS